MSLIDAHHNVHVHDGQNLKDGIVEHKKGNADEDESSQDVHNVEKTR